VIDAGESCDQVRKTGGMLALSIGQTATVADSEPQIRLACFYFGDYGPHCFRVTDVNYGLRGTIKVRISTSYHGPQFIKGYVVYIRDGKTQQTNMVRTFYSIAP